MFATLSKGKIEIETDNGKNGTFELDDHAGVLDFLRENLRKNEDMLHSSSFDFPHEYGAPRGWCFWDFMDKVERMAHDQGCLDALNPKVFWHLV